jgi:hypothetical protein
VACTMRSVAFAFAAFLDEVDRAVLSRMRGPVVDLCPGAGLAGGSGGGAGSASSRGAGCGSSRGRPQRRVHGRGGVIHGRRPVTERKAVQPDSLVGRYRRPVPSPPQDVVRDEWQAEELLHNSGNEVAGAIWRVTGDGGTAILKIDTPRRAGPPRTWPRATTQGTGTTGGAKRSRTAVCWPPPRTRASPVRTCSMCRSADGSVALWLQDVPGAPGTSAGVDALADVAYRLGAGHARWLERPPAEPWLARDWLRD